jgi:hypothetical protein
MEIIDPLFQMARQRRLEVARRQTRLFDLIAALQEEIHPSEDWIVTNIILHLFETGQVKFLQVNKTDALLFGWLSLSAQSKEKSRSNCKGDQS